MLGLKLRPAVAASLAWLIVDAAEKMTVWKIGVIKAEETRVEALIAG